MTSNTDPAFNSESEDPYALLGIEPGVPFEMIQIAREKKLKEVGEDIQAKAKIEASYESLLMSSLKERQLGKVSNEAFNASKREEGKSLTESSKSMGTSLLTRIKSFGNNEKGSSTKVEFSLPKGQNLAIKLSFALLAIVLLIVSPPSSAELILSISTISLFISQIRRGRKFIPALGWSVVLLSLGLIIGQFITSQSTAIDHLVVPLAKEQLEALPAVILLWFGVLLLD